MFQIFTSILLLKTKNASRTLNNEIILIKNLFPYKKKPKTLSSHVVTKN
jgi:hypothetical protein